ncbi:hypothetical protein [Kribbella sp. NPDC004875]|uniref:hypothetical protein n=1 Tax=Kribbella sp. NPDC004875 TaxID=3364107 RepID=UPI0036B35940
MRPLTANSLRGVWATLLLPLNADDSIDFTRLESQAQVLGAQVAAARPDARRLLPELFEDSW